jgi:hypothetical protein
MLLKILPLFLPPAPFRDIRIGHKEGQSRYA